LCVDDVEKKVQRCVLRVEEEAERVVRRGSGGGLQLRGATETQVASIWLIDSMKHTDWRLMKLNPENPKKRKILKTLKRNPKKKH
jgi:hypothetical protein